MGHRQSAMRGLRNYYLSCCVNTLLQTFNATWEIAEILEKWEPTVSRTDGNDVPLQLKKVLKTMQEDLSHPAPHLDFLHCLDRNRIRLSVQHDADEVFFSILDFIQHMDDRSLALEIQNLYKISVKTEVQCLECNTLQTHNSHLLSLPLHIKEVQNSLKDCMISFFEPQELRGIDCCFCEPCKTKTPSRQGMKLCSLPQILCIQLKRFRNMRGVTEKLNCSVTFPETFDFFVIQSEAFSSDFTQNDCRYTLFAVVVHSGYAMFGHYTAYVRHKVTKLWYYANDSYVSQSSWEEVQRTYGQGHYRTPVWSRSSSSSSCPPSDPHSDNNPDKKTDSSSSSLPNSGP
ncbi:ubl carboxyl-terminal hydrolase 18 [Anableps anableps]